MKYFYLFFLAFFLSACESKLVTQLEECKDELATERSANNSKKTNEIGINIKKEDSKDKQITIFPGAGMASCGEFLSLSKDRHVKEYFNSWGQGYMFGTLGQLNKTELLDNPKGQEIWIENYCKANPLDTYAKAANSLMEELIKRQEATKKPFSFED